MSNKMDWSLNFIENTARLCRFTIHIMNFNGWYFSIDKNIARLYTKHIGIVYSIMVEFSVQPRKRCLPAPQSGKRLSI